MTHTLSPRSLAGLFIATTSLVAPQAAAALSITQTDDALLLADTLFLNIGGIVIDTDIAPTLSGGDIQSGLYRNDTGTYGLPSSGIVLSTGDVADYVDGPNIYPGLTSADINAATDAQQDILGAITGKGSHYDVVELDITFDNVEGASTLTFFGAFGSEEYPEFVASDFNDGFGLFVNGVNYAGVAAMGSGAVQPVNIDHPDFAEIPGTELDGMLAPGGNPVLRFDVPIATGTNSFKVILADAGDSELDTTVYLSSFFAAGTGGDDPTGENEFDPLLPTASSVGPDGATTFTIPLPLEVEGTLWVDPPVTTGYTYELNGAEVSGITLPSLATVADLDGYTVEANGTIFENVMAGELLGFGFYASVFSITGIDPDLKLLPGNALAFPIGLELVNVTSGATIAITEILDAPAVPLPASLPLYLAALGLGGVAARRRAR